jgi:hypothetical protein
VRISTLSNFGVTDLQAVRLREDAFPGAKLIKGVIVRHVKLETPPRYTISNKDLIIAIKTDFARYSLPLSGKRGIKLKDLAFGKVFLAIARSLL